MQSSRSWFLLLAVGVIGGSSIYHQLANQTNSPDHQRNTGGKISLVYGQVTGVIDGDKLRLRLKLETPTGDQLGDEHDVRLFGIDAPELDQPKGQEAKDLVSEIILDQEVLLEMIRTNDEHWEALVYSVPGVSVNEIVLASGLAWLDEKRASEEEAFCVSASVARGAALGIWADADSIPPWQWRKMTAAAKQLRWKQVYREKGLAKA
ncbi:hypothetical protein Pan216_19360 [Planctomycetes bacterium Pan216]|uniref:TNase-like domain-containing protein n=1 Tax=Kolteria novifilia TaxID=2527975 RepID=A0A518B2A6_9BACT|nr:hypothetical protein Pan216_19360 [Planctomycetes bacterium Pan216]